MTFSRSLIALLVLALGLVAAPSRAAELRIAKQFGLRYLPLVVMRHDKLIEHHAAAAGVDALGVQWVRVSGGAAANDALLSGSADLVTAGLGPLLTIWDRTRGNLDVRALGSLDASVILLNTNNPAVRSIRDFGPKDRIALPAVKVSHQAVLLQMAAEQAFGPGEAHRLDPLTVSLAHPDALTALLSHHSEITAHFGNAPFMFRALEDPRVRTVLSSADVLGGPATVTSLYTTGKFRAGQPKLYRAVFTALTEAHRLIEADPARVARIYVEDEEPKADPAAILALLTRPETRFSLAPLNTEKFADFMARTGALRQRPAGWRDYFFPDLHDAPGS